eukprot:3271697-Ditylum_brightwellii.AAC.1
MEWSESFHDFLNRCIGVCMIPLAYAVQQKSVVEPNAASAIAAGQPYSAEHGSVEDEIIARATHEHPLYQQDNAL